VKYQVVLYWDGPVFSGQGIVKVEADSETDALREALAYIGLPKVKEVTVIPS
jgi:hypothetical protein